jgi:hypothetical protein
VVEVYRRFGGANVLNLQVEIRTNNTDCFTVYVLGLLFDPEDIDRPFTEKAVNFTRPHLA